MMRVSTIVMPAAAFLVTAGVSAVASYVATAGVVERRPLDARTVYSEARYNAATQPVEGSLTRAATQLLRGDGRRFPAVALVVRADDVQKCEDLGRQLRDLRRTLGTDAELLVWGESAKQSVVQDYLRLERVGKVRLQPVDAGTVLQNTPALPTPAVLVVERNGRVLAGVAHPIRFPNARFRSFAEELAEPLRLAAHGPRTVSQGAR